MLIDSKTSSGILSLPDNAQGSSIARRKPRALLPRYIDKDISDI